MGLNLRSGTSGLTREDEQGPQPILGKAKEQTPTLNVKTERAEVQIAGKEEAQASLECPNPELVQATASPAPTETAVATIATTPVTAEYLIDQFKNEGSLTREEVMITLAESALVRDWAKRLISKYQPEEPVKPRPITLPLAKSVGTPAFIQSEHTLMDSMQHFMSSTNDLTEPQFLNAVYLDKLAARIARLLEMQGGADLKALFRFTHVSRSSYDKTAGVDDEETVWEHDDSIVHELREAIGLANKLYEARGGAKGGLTMRDIVRQHAAAAMHKAWAILSLIATATEEAFQRDAKWGAVVRATEQLIWHTSRAQFGECHMVAQLQGWLVDAKGPRVRDLGARLVTLRRILYPTGTAELQDADSFATYGLAQIDRLELEKWPLWKIGAVEDLKVPAEEGDDNEDVGAGETDFLPPKRQRTLELAAPGPSSKAGPKSNPVIDRMVRNLMEDQESALADDYSQYY
jgi:hypothetical protein